MLSYADAQVLDVTGPLEVFARAARWMRENGLRDDDAYTVSIAAACAGPLRVSSGIQLIAAEAYASLCDVDTLFVTGGIGYAQAMQDQALLTWLRSQAACTQRIGSICTGALVLGAAGLLDGQRATTHWRFCAELARLCPNASIEADAIYVRSGRLYTSAGVTAGLDLALAMVEEDHGRDVAMAVARELVLFLKRPGGQSQFSSFMAAQSTESERFQSLQLWILDHLDEDLSVQRLADQACMSPRNFGRSFQRETGYTPARFVQQARMQAARRALEDTGAPVAQVARHCGFSSSETMRRTFIRQLKVSPSDYRARFARH